MNKSESIGQLAAALAKAQRVMGGASKDASNPFFKSHYSTLASVIDAIREPLTSNGLSFVQLTQPSEKNEVVIETVLMHESGEWVSSITCLPVAKADAQGYGSAITYAKRYGVQALTGCPSEDDDGNAAAQAAPKAAAPKPVAKSVPPAVKAKVEDIQKPAKGTISGDDSEGDLTGIGPDRPVDEVTKGKVLHAFASIGFTLPMLEQEYGKPLAEWMESDVVDARDLLKSLKISAAQAKAQAAEMAANPDGGEI
jgi:hypothetical protein